jgi:hypothetical protein
VLEPLFDLALEAPHDPTVERPAADLVRPRRIGGGDPSVWSRQISMETAKCEFWPDPVRPALKSCLREALASKEAATASQSYGDRQHCDPRHSSKPSPVH